MTMQLNEYIPSEHPNILIHGRTSSVSPLSLFWTGSGIELYTTGTQLYINLESGFQLYEQWIRIVVNDYTTIRMPLQKGTQSICVFHHMTPGGVKHVRLIKEVQPMQDDPDSFLKVCSVQCDGQLLPAPERKRKIEFIGDSITSGEGLAGTRETCDWVSMIFTTEHHYALETCKHLNADYRIISQSGWGVYAGWDNNPNKTLSKYYTQVCGVLQDEQNRALGSCEAYDFSAWKPDAVVVNLGCNDSFAFNSPEWVDPVSGDIWKLRLNADGTYHEEDTKKISKAVYAFIELIRKCNPSAYIVWCYGMIGRGLQPYIEHAVKAYRQDTGDKHVSFLLLPDLLESWIAANNHPGIPSHLAASATLSQQLNHIFCGD